MLAYYTHTTATTAESGLDDDGKAILVGKGLDILKLLDGPRGSWHNGDVALDGEFSRRDLVAERVDGVGRGAHELKAKVSMSRILHGWEKKAMGAAVIGAGLLGDRPRQCLISRGSDRLSSG